MAKLQEFYKSDVAPALMKKFGYKSPMQIPRLDKVVVNVGAGDAKDNAKVIDSIINDLTAITGQKAVPTTARKSVSNFKLRAGVHIGAKVTLRGDRMYEFVDKFCSLSPESGTSRASTPIRSTAAEIIPAGSRNSSYSPRSSMTRSTRSGAWTYAS